MSSRTALHLDPKVKKLSLEAASKLELRVCCICGVIKDASEFEDCISCDGGFMCVEHNTADHKCDCSVKNESAQTMPVDILLNSKTVRPN